VGDTGLEPVTSCVSSRREMAKGITVSLLGESTCAQYLVRKGFPGIHREFEDFRRITAVLVPGTKTILHPSEDELPIEAAECNKSLASVLY
jgi:hypothetical protein